ncbi:MAG: hypothetical protein AAGB93_10910 [Planctomycetota bacterium]
MTNTLSNHVGLTGGAVLEREGGRSAESRSRDTRIVIREIAVGVVAAASFLALTWSFGASGELHRHLFLAIAIVLFAVGLRVVGDASTQVRSSEVAPDAEARERRLRIPHQPTSTTGYTLIDGEFQADDAKDMLLTLIDREINAFKLRSLSALVRADEPDDGALAQISDLNATRERVELVVSEAIASGRRIRVHSTVQLEIESDVSAESNEEPRRALV